MIKHNEWEKQYIENWFHFANLLWTSFYLFQFSTFEYFIIIKCLELVVILMRVLLKLFFYSTTIK